MAVSTATAIDASEAGNPLLDGVCAVDYKGRPIIRSESGGWRSASFIIGVEAAERFAFLGVSCNLISYLTGPLGQSTAAAAENVNAFYGTVALLPLLGAFVADSFLGRYRTIIIASVLYILGLGLLTLSVVLISLGSFDCRSAADVSICSVPQLQVFFFFFSLYLAAIAQGGYQPCLQAFGADQFDAQDPQECKAKSSFFNWWQFGACFGTLTSQLILYYIQDDLNWGLGFGIPCIVMAFVLVTFLLGSTTYRFAIKSDEKRPFIRIGRVFVKAARKWRITPSAVAMEAEAQGLLHHEGFDQFKFLNKALIAADGLKEDSNVCSINEVVEAKAVLRLVPISAACLVYPIVFSQSFTFFTKQGATMDRSIGSSFDISAASLQSFTSLSTLIFIPIYDCIFVPIARAFTRKPSGITLLQRIGIGIFLSVIYMVTAAMVERKRLKTALEYGLLDKPTETVPMSVWWLVPQYMLIGIANVFTMVGLQEFFYDQVPSEFKSVGISLYFSIFGVGSFLSSFLVSVVEKATGGSGQDSWFSSNLNRAHLDYFYWLLAGLSVVASIAYLYFAKSYIYNRRSNI